MSFFFGLLDILLTTIILYDTLGLAYQLRKVGECETKDYLRVCLTWILFLSIYNLLSCSWKGFFGFLMRLLILLLKIFVAIPKFNGTLIIYKYLIEDGNAEKWYKQIIEKIKPQLCKVCPPTSESAK